MNQFVNTISEQEARTENNMKARLSTASANVDLFFKVGASRGRNIIPQFTAAFVENNEVALRVMQWARDVRGGAGERELFRQVLQHLEITNEKALIAIIPNIPEIGRWDDLLVFQTAYFKILAYRMIAKALAEGNALCAKWMPRKGPIAIELRNVLEWSPKRYRKTLVNLTNVVETPMCANHWDEIDYEKVPSLAAARYKKAFDRHSVQFAEYAEKAAKGEAKVNAGAVFPYDVLNIIGRWSSNTPAELNHIRAQWNALPNLMGDSSVLPMVDVSGSMTHQIGDNLTCLDVAVSLGLYTADKSKGAFKDVYLTFSNRPELVQAKGDIIDKVNQLTRANWDMNTNLIAAIDLILSHAIKFNVPREDMPETLVVFSDMQFDKCVKFDDSAYEAFGRRFENEGYILPKIVFWNLRATDNVPVKFNQHGVALVSGFSPTIMGTVLNGDMEQFTPEAVMLKAIMSPRYDLR